MTNKRRLSVFLVVIFGVTIQHINTKDNSIYKAELKALKKKQPYSVMFDKHSDPILRDIVRNIENCKEMSLFQRMIRSAFLALDTVIVTPATMPQLHGYIASICKEYGIRVPTIFITKDKWFFNAAAQKLLTSSGAIVIGQDLLNEVSDEELEAVTAHEIGHIFHNHVNKMIATRCFSVGLSAVSFYMILRGVVPERLKSLPTGRIALVGSVVAGPILADLITGKRYERQADTFACSTTGTGEGLIKFFGRLQQKEQKPADDLAIVSDTILDNRPRLEFGDYIGMNMQYYVAKTLHKVNTLARWFYYNTPFGPHPSPSKRIEAVKEHFNEA